MKASHPEEGVPSHEEACQTLSKVLDISSSMAWVIPDQLKVKHLYLTQLSEDLQLIEKTKNHIDNQEKDHISLGGQHRVIYKFFKGFTNHRKKTNMVVVFTLELFPMFLINTGATDETFQQSGK